MLRQLLKEGNYSREEIFSGNTVRMGIKSDADNQTMHSGWLQYWDSIFYSQFS